MFFSKKYPRDNEQRRYYRLKSIFPVEVSVLDENDNELEGVLYHAFSRDVSLGGIKLEISKFDPALLDRLLKKEYRLLIKMEIPPHERTHPSIAEVHWISYEKEKNKYYLGLRYLRIDPQVRNELFSHARWGVWKTRLLKGIFLLLALFFVYAIYTIKNLRHHALDLQRENISVARDRSFYSSQIDGLRQREDELTKKLHESEERIRKIEKMYQEVSADDSLKKEIEILKKEREELKDQLAAIQKGRLTARRQMKKTEDAKLTQKTIQSLLGWMRVKQSSQNGLIPSFSGDDELKDVSYTYDQALAVIAFSLCNDGERAKKILDYYKFFAAKNEEGVYYNGYYTSGTPSEYVVHVGPNTWLGISAVQYFLLTGDPSYLQMAKKIAVWLKGFMDEEGGLKGGPGITWYSTEHNLDAYAFFDMVYYVTRDKEYLALKERSLKWIMEHGYDNKLKRFRRGRGDSTIATDTFSWGIAAIGPEALTENSMEPFSIIDYAEENCKVTTSFRNRHGQVIQVTGFDFARSRHIGRGGVVSTEWTAQMAVAYAIMADYCWSTGDFQQSEKYMEQYRFFLNELQKMLIVSSDKKGVSHLCLPYASQPEADTGHGWRTPGGKKTESLSSSSYYIFTLKRFNPISYRENEAYYKVKPTGKTSQMF